MLGKLEIDAGFFKGAKTRTARRVVIVFRDDEDSERFIASGKERSVSLLGSPERRRIKGSIPRGCNTLYRRTSF